MYKLMNIFKRSEKNESKSFTKEGMLKIDESQYQVEELHFFEKYYYETLVQKAKFIDNLKLFFAASLASFGYIAWIVHEWREVNIFNPIAIISIVAVIMIFSLILLNIYIFYLSCCVFNPKGYRELPEAVAINDFLKGKSNSHRVEYLKKQYYECATHNSKINDNRKKTMSKLFKALIVDAIAILVTFIPTLVIGMGLLK